MKGMYGKILTPLKDGELDKAPTNSRLGVIAMMLEQVRTEVRGLGPIEVSPVDGRSGP